VYFDVNKLRANRGIILEVSGGILGGQWGPVN